MTVRQDTYSLPLSQPNYGLTMYDEVLNTIPYQSLWSPGNTTLGTPPISPQVNQKYSLQAVGVTGQLVLFEQGAAYGKLGKILGGILTPGSPEANAAYEPEKLAPLPNPNLTFTVWDPAVDDLPPMQPNIYSLPSVPTLPVSAEFALPNPLNLLDSEGFVVGLWMLPMLVGFNMLNGSGGTTGAGALGMAILEAQYTLTYDDGVPA